MTSSKLIGTSVSIHTRPSSIFISPTLSLRLVGPHNPACRPFHSSRQTHAIGIRSSVLTAAAVRPRPRQPDHLAPWAALSRARLPPHRTIFIQTETTPNPDAIKFLPNHRILSPEVTVPFVEYLSPRSTLAPPYPSQLAARLMNIDGVTSVFYGANFITVTKAPGTQWAHIRPEVFALITQTVTSGEEIVNVVATPQTQGDGMVGDSLSYDANDSEVVGMIKELLETRIRPAIQEDGGDVEFRGFEDGIVKLMLRGACRTCDSSTVTLKNGIEGMLMHYIEEVKGAEQVLEEEEEFAMKEFAKFEEKLRQQHEKQQQRQQPPPSPPPTGDSGTGRV